MRSFCRIIIIAALFLFLSTQGPAYSQDADLEKAHEFNQQVVDLFSKGQYAEAIPIAKKALAIREKALGPEHPNTAQSLNNLGLLYNAMDDYANAEPLYQRALAIHKKALGLGHPSTAISLNNLGSFYRAMGDYSKAEPLLKRALAIREKSLGPQHPDTATSLNNLALLYQNMGAYAKAEPLYKRALAICEKALGPEHRDTTANLDNLADLYRTIGDYTKAEPLHQRALAVREKVLGPEHPGTATSLNNLAWLYYKMGDYPKAKSLYQRALAIHEKTLGPEHSDTATNLNNLALLYQNMGAYAKAEPLYQRALDIYEKALGPEHPSTAASLNNLGLLYQNMGAYAKAEPLYQRALDIYEKALGPEHPSTATSLDNLATLYSGMGDYAKAEPLHQSALAVREKALGSEHPDTAQSLNNLGELYQVMGNYAKAEPLHQRALAIYEKALGPEHPDTANSLNYLASLNRAIGDYAKAEPMLQRTLAVHEKVLGPEHPSTASSMSNLAGLYLYMGDYTKAEPLSQRALAISEKALGPDHPSTATNLNDLALLYQAMGDYAKAEPLYQRTLALFEKVLGPEHPDTAHILSNLAVLYHHMGDYANAKPLYQRALAIREKALGPEHPETAMSLNNLAWLYAYLGKYREAHQLSKRAQTIDEKMIDQVSGFTSESQTMKYLATRKAALYHFLSLVNRHLSHDASATIAAVNVWLKRKGFVLEAQKRFQEALVYADDPEAIQTFQELSRTRAQLSRLTFGGPGKDGIDAYKRKIARLEKQKEALETRLARLSKAFVEQQKVAGADCAKVAGALPENTALVEFVRYSDVNFKAKGREERWFSDRYLAFVLHAGKGDRVEWIDLGPADRIDETIASFKKEMLIGNITAENAGEASKKLYNLVFEPLKKGLGDVTELFISPDGNLNLIPFEVLQTPGGRFLIEDYTFNYLAVGRDILGFGKSEKKAKKALIIGDPDFDLGMDEKTSILRRLDLDRPESSEIGKRSIDMQGFHFKRLPGTREEVKKIGALLGDQKAEVYTGKEAIEELLKQKSAPLILHLATHGFFLNDLDLSALADTRLVQMVSMEPVVSGKIKIENPLLRSGFALAGANNALRVGDREKSDGIVTAEKILGLRLRGTDMVVLSACETGLGEVKAGEGVFGLRRAFTQAGARSMVMSLWSVPDRETKELMVEFYKNIQSGNMDRCRALRQAALKQMKIVKQRYGHPHPLYWGAFVFLGEP